MFLEIYKQQTDRQTETDSWLYSQMEMQDTDGKCRDILKEIKDDNDCITGLSKNISMRVKSLHIQKYETRNKPGYWFSDEIILNEK